MGVRWYLIVDLIHRGYSSDSTPSLGTSTCHKKGPINSKKTKKKKIGHLNGIKMSSQQFCLRCVLPVPVCWSPSGVHGITTDLTSPPRREVWRARVFVLEKQ